MEANIAMGAKEKKSQKKKMLISQRPDTFTICQVTIEEGVKYIDADTFAIYKDAEYIYYI